MYKIFEEAYTQHTGLKNIQSDKCEALYINL